MPCVLVEIPVLPKPPPTLAEGPGGWGGEAFKKEKEEGAEDGGGALLSESKKDPWVEDGA